MPAPGLRQTFTSDGGGSSSSSNIGSAKQVSGSVNVGSAGLGSRSGSSYYDVLRQISDANNAFNLAQVDMVNHFNAHEAQKNRDWQERMSRNAHQYEVEDLIKAGLNPVLSAGGQGAYVGSGAVASGQKAVADSIYGNGVIQLMQSAMAAASAENVARIYAAAQMYGHDISKYGYDKNASNQLSYQNTLRENNILTNQTSASNNSMSNWFGVIRALPYLFLGTQARLVARKFNLK